MAVDKSFNNGVYVSQIKYPDITIGSLDVAHVMKMNRSNTSVTDLGMLEPFIQSGYMARKPIFVDAFKPSSVMYVEPNGIGRYKFTVPVPATETYLVEDISGMDKPGLDGTEFKLRFNKFFTGKTSIIKFALDADVEFHVVDYERAGEHWDYTLQIQAVDSKDKYLPKLWSRPGQRVYISSSVVGEYSTEWNTINEGALSGGGEREFYNYVGSGYAGVKISVTRDGAYSMLDNKMTASINAYADLLSVTEFLPGTLGYMNKYQDQGAGKSPMKRYMEKYGNSEKKATEAIMKESVRSVMPKIEYIAKMQVLSDARTQAMWGTGGAIKVDGNRMVHLPVGLWFQLQKGNYFTYNITDFSLEMIEKHVRDVWKNKVQPYGEKITTVIKTGMGGYELAKRQIAERHKNRGMMIMDKDFVQGSGFHQGLLASEFDWYEWAYGVIKFEADPSFDPIDTDYVSNPILSGRFSGQRLSSFVFMIPDVTGQDDNIVEVRKKDHWDFTHMVHQGKLKYPISGGLADVNGGQPFITGDYRMNHGFEVVMEKPHVAMLMKDYTKTVVIRPYNPETGRALYSSYFD